MSDIDDPADKNNITDIRLRLWRNGYAPVPCEGKAAKRPGWPTQLTFTEAEIVGWPLGYPNCTNTGFVCTYTPVFDLDILDQEAVEDAEQIISEAFDGAEHLLIRFGNFPKRAIPFQTDKPFKKIKVEFTNGYKIEVLGEGQQCLAHGFNPDAKCNYRWHNGSIFDIPHDDLPGLDEATARNLVAKIVAMLETKHGFQRVGLKSQDDNEYSTSPGWDAEFIVHDDDVSFAMKLLKAGMHDGAAVNLMRTLIEKYADKSDPERVTRRLHEVPDYVRSARGKLGEPRLDKRPPLIWFDDIAEPILDTKDFVQGLLFDKSLAVIYGRSGTGKTFFTTTAYLHVAAGIDVARQRVEQGGVVYCVLEGNALFVNRILAWKQEHKLTGEKLPFAAVPYHVNMRDPNGTLQALIADATEAANRMVREHNLPLRAIVIDTLARAMSGGNENSPDDMGLLIQNSDRLRAALGVQVAYIHHSGKDEARGSRGHSSLEAAEDTGVEVTEDAAVHYATVVKQREGAKGLVIPFELASVEMGTNKWGEPVTTCLVRFIDAPPPKRRAKMSPDQQRAYDILVEVIDDRGLIGFNSVPPGLKSVPEDWWRERYYERAKVGSDQETKQRSFRRCADALVNFQRIGTDKGRVWIAR